MASDRNQLKLLIQTRTPIITIETEEEQRAADFVLDVVRDASMNAYLWNVVNGLRAWNAGPAQSTGPIANTQKPADCLAHLITKNWPAVVVMMDLCTHLEDATLRRMLRTIALDARKNQQTLVLIDPVSRLGDGLARSSIPFDLALPDEAELETIVRSTFKELAQFSKISTELTKGQLQHVIRTLRGLTADEARLAISRVILDDNCLNAADIDRLMTVKREMIREGGLLEYIDDRVRLDDIGGLASLKDWLSRRRGALSPKARKFGLKPPRGVLLLGVQGCGKSAACKAIAAAWQMPLVKLDPGQFYDKYVGESERNLRKAIHQAESMAPVVLWIDEIEKAFASAGAVSADGGLSKRMFGTLLHWLQDHRSPIFTAATANDITALPPELVRKGRFDEIFFVDLPGAAVRKKIFAIHLTGIQRDPAKFDLTALSAAANRFSGSEIEQAVMGSLYRAFHVKCELKTEHIMEEIEHTRPLAVTMANRIDELRDWARDRCVPAD